MSAKVKSLETDRAKIMNAVENIASEMGKINAFITHANYELDHTEFTKAKALEDFYNGEMGSTILTSAGNNRLALVTLVQNAKPANSELNSLYNALETLRIRYNDCYVFIRDPGDARTFKERSSTVLNAYNTQLSALGFNKFMTSAYTTADKNQAYASMLKSAQSSINGAVSAFSSVQNKIVGLGSFSYKYDGKDTLGKNISTYMNAMSNLGKLNAYRLMLLGASSAYSSSYSNISVAYNSLTSALNSHAGIPYISYNEYVSGTNTSINNSRNYAANIGNAIR